MSRRRRNREWTKSPYKEVGVSALAKPRRKPHAVEFYGTAKVRTARRGRP